MQTQKPVNFELIQQSLNAAPKFKDALQLFANRERGRQDTTFRRLKRLLDTNGMKAWTAAEIQQFFEMLQAAGAGRIVYGSKTPRIIWDWHLNSIACKALGLPETMRERKDGTPIPASAESLRKPTPARRPVPRLLSPAIPVLMKAKAPTVVPIKAPKAGSEIITLRGKGIEIEVDLASMTPEGCKKLTAILIG